MSISLYKHNEDAYRVAVSMLSETGKAAIVHPTGTGKSFIGFKLCEERPDARVCWLSPSEYIFSTQLENLKAACGYKPQNISFYTYAKLILMNKAEIKEVQADYIIMDEYHRAGAPFWQVGVETLLNAYPTVPILGLSATNIRYLDNRRDMAEDLFDGNIASEMTLGEAIVRGILNPPKYVLSVFSYQNDLERYKRRVRSNQSPIVRDTADRYLEALRRALEKAEGLEDVFKKHMTDISGKYIVFCTNWEHMEEMVSHVPEWFGDIDKNPSIYKAYSADPTTSKALSDFKADSSEHLKLLFCIDMLNEGIHMDDISGVILFRPTVSPIVYKQQIGGAMSATKKNDVVILDIVNNISILYSIGAIEEEMAEAVEYFTANGDREDIVNERFKVIDEVKDCKRLFDELENTLSASWDLMFFEAKGYFEDNGDLLVPYSYVTADGYHLGRWVKTQRGIYKGSIIGALSDEQIQKLSSIGMSWDFAHERFWEEKFKEAVRHYTQHGDLLPPYQSSGLRYWIYAQRDKYKNGTLLQDKADRLSAIGMVWEFDDSWDMMFVFAKDYFEEHGDLDIPARFVTEGGAQLGTWYRKNIFDFRKGQLSEERLKRLESIGFQHEQINQRTWTRYLDAARAYKDEHGDLNVHVDYTTDDGLKLGKWISVQRYSYQQERLPKQKEEQLEALGMQWLCFDAKWNMGYEHLIDYVSEYDDANVPAVYVCEDGYKLGA